MFRSILPLLALLAASPALAAGPGVSLVDQNGAYLGTPTNPVVTGTATQNAPGTSGTRADGVQGVIGGVPLPIGGALWWVEANSVSVAAGGNQAGATRGSGATAGIVAPFGYYTAVVQSSAAGTMTIYNNGAQYSQSVAANTPSVLKIPAFGLNMNVVFFCGGATACTSVSIADGFTLN